MQSENDFVIVLEKKVGEEKNERPQIIIIKKLNKHWVIQMWLQDVK